MRWLARFSPDDLRASRCLDLTYKRRAKEIIHTFVLPNVTLCVDVYTGGRRLGVADPIDPRLE